MRRLPFCLLLVLLAGCSVPGCPRGEQLPATPAAGPAADPAAEAAIDEVIQQAQALYQGQDSPFIPERDYDVVLALLRTGVQKYGAAAAAAKLQLMLADITVERQKYYNNREMVVFQQLSADEVNRRLQGQRGAGSTFDEALQHAEGFDTACREYETVITQWPRSPEAPVALYKLADLHAATFNRSRDLERAAFYYRKLTSEYSNASNGDWALYSLGLTYREMGRTAEAQEMFRKLLNDYPQFPAEQRLLIQKYLDQPPALP